MKRIQLTATAGMVLVASVAVFAWAQQSREPMKIREEASALRQQGNWQEALVLLKTLLVDQRVSGREAVADLRSATDCLAQLGLQAELDDLLSKTLAVRGNDWRVLLEAAKQLNNTAHYGMVADQKFVRNPQNRSPTGQWINVNEHDRQQSLQWLRKALVLAGELQAAPNADEQLAATDDKGSAEERSGIWLQMVQVLLSGRQDRWGWRLQLKTDLVKAPDYLDWEAPSDFPMRYASVDETGKPIFWAEPDSWTTATSDAERLRWALKQIDLLDDVTAQSDAQLAWANFLHSQFAVDTLQEQMWLMRSHMSEKAADGVIENKQSGILALHTLGEHETIAKLASGIRRFDLPEELNPLRIYQKIAEREGSSAETAQQQLVTTFMNRRQYSRAADMLQQSIERFGDPHSDKRDELDNMIKPRGAFDPIPSQSAGQPAKLGFLFRNAHSVAFTARKVDVDKIVSDIKAFCRGAIKGQSPNFGGRKDRSPPPIEHLEQLFTEEQLEQYVGESIASWTQELEPRANHWDRRLTITTPLDRAGLYVVDALLDDGAHRARCLVWIKDLAIVQKVMSNSQLVFVADAITGEPVAGANVEFFGMESARNNRQTFVTQNFARKTDAQGQIVLADPKYGSKQWMVIARDARGRQSVSGWGQFWFTEISRQSYTQFRAYGVADQPVHRPGDKLRAKFWVGRASYDPENTTAPLRGSPCQVRLLDPRGELFLEASRVADEYGGIDVEFDLPKAARLGVYQFQIRTGDMFFQSNLRVRVEEFRKPEFEVKVEAPEKPIKLGDKIEARVVARYYFGTPVTDAYVNVKVTRTAYVDNWYPARPFDWCYGPGYWWFAYDYAWYPGWDRWLGSRMPTRAWLGSRNTEPAELVFEQEVRLDSEGVAMVTIDSSLAAQTQGKQDHKYQIEVEVRDASRRTQTATGSVIASREPFKIYTWLNRGFYKVNDAVEANFLAQTLDRRPIAAEGKVELLRVTYDAARQPQETVVETWDAKTDAEGMFQQRFVARRGGQYRLRLRLESADGHEVEGAYVFTVRGEDQVADNFRFAEIELVADKSEYAPGEKVQLQISAERAGATVLLFVRPTGGVVPPPKLIKLPGKSAIYEIDVVADDQPNFFVEALTIYNGKFYWTMREIIVPPANRVLNVSVKPDKEEYRPGEKARLDIEVKDDAGKPVSGSVLVAVYDRALEQIAADTLPEDIRAYFWKWRRSHQPTNSENLTRVTHPVGIDGRPVLRPIGVFGFNLDDDSRLVANSRGMEPMLADLGGRNYATGAFGAPGADRGMNMEAMAAPQAAGGAMKSRSMSLGVPMLVSNDEAPEMAAPKVRQEFADSALWLTNLKCDSNGRAQADYKMPENLSDWQMQSWVLGPNLRVGSGTASAVTHKPLLVRLTTPRFLTQRDDVMVSAIVHNDSDAAHKVRVRLEIDGQTQLELHDGVAAESTIHIAAHEQARIDWMCHALAAGEVTLRAFAESAAESDAMQLKVPIIVNGMLKTDSWAGTVRADQPVGSLDITVPEQRRAEHSRLTVRMSPSLALAMVDALPYLVEYPYECTEQTLNRFLPTVMTQRLLLEMKVDLQQVKQRRNNLNAQELGDPQQRAVGWKRFDRNPVFDQSEVDRMVQEGVQHLANMQNADGGWGWFSGSQARSEAHTTSTVVRGLLVARANGVAIVPDLLERGLVWLEQYQLQQLAKMQEASQQKPAVTIEPSNLDALVFHTLVASGRKNDEMHSKLFERRASLNVYGKALLAWATHRLGNREQTDMLRRNIEQFLVEDAENETAYLRDQSPWWYWYGSQIEATAIYLKLLAAQEPKGRVAPRLVKYLLNNRKHATYWNSTRDTALVVEAFTDYLRASGETQGNVSGEVWLGGKRLGSVSFTPATLFTAETTLQIAGDAVPTGRHSLEIRRQGAGPLYYSAYLTNFTLEEKIQPAGLELKIERRFYRLDPVDQQLDLAGDRAEIVQAERSAWRRVPIANLDAVASGALVEVELLIDSKNDYEYLLIEEHKAAGMEPVDTQSGVQFVGGLDVYREMREKHVAFLLRTLPRGQHSLRYRLRAEAPGQFTALPAVIRGMYAPELIGNSSDKDIRIEDAK